MAKENIRTSMDISIEGGANYQITDNRIVIKNVPITGEIVQQYHDGIAYKPLEEIRKVIVDNVPVTFLHPDTGVNDMPTHLAAENVHGFLRRPSLEEKNEVHEDKLYADLVLFRSDSTKHLEENLEKGQNIDVSIGFQFMKEEKKGSFLGKAYDYIQRKLKLDHLAILIDTATGNILPGRAPAPYYGIGADQLSEEDKKMSEENIKTVIDKNETLQNDNNKLQTEVDNLKSTVSQKDEAMQKLQSDYDELKKEKDEEAEKLKKFEEADAAEVDKKRNALKEKFPSMEKVFDSADKESIESAYDEMEKENKKTLEDAGQNKQVSNDLETLKNQFRSVKTEEQ